MCCHLLPSLIVCDITEGRKRGEIPVVDHRRKMGSTLSTARTQHASLPLIRRVPFAALSIVLLVSLLNGVVWIVVGILLHFHPALISTALLSYTLGLRHALHADHISAIDLMTRRLIVSGQRPVTVGTFFSLGHSTIVIVTSIAVAATAAALENKFDGFGTVRGIIGTAVSATFLILLGVMNAYVLYSLIKQMNKVLHLCKGEEEQAWKIEGGGCLFGVLKKMFKLIDRPWKMYPLGVLFGLGFDTSSEIALLGISSVQAAKGTSMWLMLIFPVLFTAGMCLIDTIDGAFMLTVYLLPYQTSSDGPKAAPMFTQTPEGNSQCEENGRQPRKTVDETVVTVYSQPNEPLSNGSKAAPLLSQTREGNRQCEEDGRQRAETVHETAVVRRAKDPTAFLYYSIVLTILTVMVALVIGSLQLLILVRTVKHPTGPFWDAVKTAGDYYQVIGGSICGSFIVVGGLSVLCYKPWKRLADRAKMERERSQDTATEHVPVNEV